MAEAGVTGLTLVAVGSVPARALRELPVFLSERTGEPCTVSEAIIDPFPAYNARRGQYDSRVLLTVLDALAEKLGTRVLGIADVDLYSPVFVFVLGEAKLGGRAALLSLHRLRPTEYGLPENPELLLSRARREALHEVGHLLGLLHCRDPDCVMRFSGAPEEVDLKSDRLCESCAARFGHGDSH